MSSVPTTVRFNRRLQTKPVCAVCNSQAVGINFGALTCAPCKGI